MWLFNLLKALYIFTPILQDYKHCLLPSIVAFYFQCWVIVWMIAVCRKDNLLAHLVESRWELKWVNLSVTQTNDAVTISQFIQFKKHQNISWKRSGLMCHDTLSRRWRLLLITPAERTGAADWNEQEGFL